MLGSSPLTSIVGYVMIVITVINQVFVEQGIPTTVHGWVVFVGGITTGIGLRLAKDSNVSNALNPSPDAKPVK